jgi:hypothetical protein
MTGKVLDNSATGLLILILPIAVGIVVLFTAWPLLLLILLLTIAWKIWDNHQWQQWSEAMNPLFNQIIKDNQGCLTVMDLSLKANLPGSSARRFLERKAGEYGAQQQDYPGKGTVYYFLTASALGSIFDESEPLEGEGEEEKEEQFLPSATTSKLAALLEESEPAPPPSTSPFAQLIDLKKSQPPQPEPVAEMEEPTVEEETAPSQPAEALSLIQSELAKRLDTNPSTIGRRKSDPDFPEWSQSKDPEGIAWKYNAKRKLFVSYQPES